jgi:hypothetical protein
MQMQKFTLPITSIGLLAVASMAHAQLFNFENEVGSVNSEPGAYTNLVMTEGGVTVNLSRVGGSTFDVLHWQFAGFPASWGSKHLSPFSNTQGGAFVATFSQAVSGVSIEFGDFLGDNDEAFLMAYAGANGTGALLGSDFQSYPITMTLPNDVKTLSVGGPGITSIVFGGGGATHPQSLYWDNLRLNTDGAIPGPTAALPFALAFLVRRRRIR